MSENKKCVYFTRHGQTFWNVEDKICGSTDIALTEYGQEQAIALGQKILEEGLQIDEILYSPLIRAADTARHISEIKAKTNFICSYEGGETMLHLCQRVYNLLDDINERNDGKTYLLVAHNGISRVIESYFHDMTNEEFAKFGIRNCELKKYWWVE